MSVRQCAEAVGLGQFYPAFYSPASGMQHLDMSGLISQTSANVLDLEVAPSETLAIMLHLFGDESSDETN